MQEQDLARHLEIEQARLPRYRNFCETYGIEDFELFVALYDIDELSAHLPPHPTEAQKEALQGLIGTKGDVGYIDYRKSNHTFELIMQWQEKLQDFSSNALFFTQEDKPDDRS